ncbi:MAG TPA: hypothetical protein VLB76_04095 [Thermoanaerobaculia bacterium]|nr:hypothetical protein [Thermoanaerobaculia bacterium]
MAGVDSGEIHGLALDRGLYPEASVNAAVEAFREHCLFAEAAGTGGMDIHVRPEQRSESRQILGAFLNFLLCDALSRRAS